MYDCTLENRKMEDDEAYKRVIVLTKKWSRGIIYFENWGHVPRKLISSRNKYMDRERELRIKRARARKRRERERKIRILIISFVVLLVLVIALLLRWVMWNPVENEVVMEAGGTITLDMFVQEEGAQFVTDVSAIDTTKVGAHNIIIQVGNQEFDSMLTIRDTLAPTADGVEVTTKTGVLPEASSCVKNVKDASEVKIAYKTQPDVSKGGNVPVVIVLTDARGNATEISTVIHVIADTEAPVISGVTDKTITVGESVSYRTGVTVTDNEDENPTLTIDNSKVNLNEPGEYEVVFIATDAAGNSSSETMTLTVKKKPSNEVDEDKVMDLANDILKDITNESMSDMEVAFAIYRWANRNIGYVNDSDKSSWVKAAYQAFTKKSGDCYNYFAAAKALFMAAGIDNVDVVKSDTSHSRHYWSLINLGDGWYHVDCTPRKGTGDLFFMVTDAELEAYSKAHSNSHIFDSDAYPERATESVQDKVDYSGGKIKD